MTSPVEVPPLTDVPVRTAVAGLGEGAEDDACAEYPVGAVREWPEL